MINKLKVLKEKEKIKNNIGSFINEDDKLLFERIKDIKSEVKINQPDDKLLI